MALVVELVDLGEDAVEAAAPEHHDGDRREGADDRGGEPGSRPAARTRPPARRTTRVQHARTQHTNHRTTVRWISRAARVLVSLVRSLNPSTQSSLTSPDPGVVRLHRGTRHRYGGTGRSALRPARPSGGPAFRPRAPVVVPGCVPARAARSRPLRYAPCMRNERRERDRYPRASLREQLGGEARTLLGNTPLVILLLVLVGGWLVLTLTRPETVAVGELGDRRLPVHPRGGRGHGHGDGPGDRQRRRGRRRAVRGGRGARTVRRIAQPRGRGRLGPRRWLRRAAPGRPCSPGSGPAARRRSSGTSGGRSRAPASTVTVAVPPQVAWDESARAAACLVAQRDGAFLSSPARESGR